MEGWSFDMRYIKFPQGSNAMPYFQTESSMKYLSQIIVCMNLLPQMVVESTACWAWSTSGLLKSSCHRCAYLHDPQAMTLCCWQWLR